MNPKGVLLDLDGVLEGLCGPEDGLVGLFKGLLSACIPHAVVTNDIRAVCYERRAVLEQAGISLQSVPWITPFDALKSVLDDQGLVCPLFIGAPVPDRHAWLRRLPASPDCLVLGDIRAEMEDLRQAWPAVRELPIFVLQRNPYMPAEDGQSKDVGYYIEAARRELLFDAEIVGKPSARMYEIALEAIGRNADASTMISDSFFVDLQGALNIGMEAILVRKYASIFDIEAAKNTVMTVGDIRELTGVLIS